MDAKRHPDYPEEKTYHGKVLGYVDRGITSLTTRMTDEGDIIPCVPREPHDQDRLRDLRGARAEPYFGRIDWVNGKQERETFYLGKSYLNLPGPIKVYSWAAGNLGADLWYAGETGHERGDLLRKRQFAFAQSELSDIRDLYVAEGHEAESTVEFADDVLRDLLSKYRDGQLADIVATIQRRQYEIIKAPKDQVLVIQGAPGSGKTSIALHRVAYLLYNHRDTLKNVLVLGPNRLFLSFAAGILPALGEHGIPQRSFDEWLAAQLGEQVAYESQDASLERLLDTGRDYADRALEYRVARLKGSLAMGMLLDRYVAQLREQALAGLEPLEVRYPPRGMDTATRSPEQVRAIFAELTHLPLATQREEAERRLERELVRELRQRRARADETRPLEQIEREYRDVVAREVRAYLAAWPDGNLRAHYRALFRTPALLSELAAGLFDDVEQAMLALANPAPTGALPFSDLAALCYLRLKLEGLAGKPYDHLVVDEAQDLTPLHFQVLAAHMHTPSMTVLGDLAQGIYAQHGLTTWDEITAAFGGVPIQFERISQSYRSTEQIIEFSNAVLHGIGADRASLAEPFARSGPRPSLLSFPSRAARAKAIGDLLRQERGAGRNSIAIIAKTAAACRQIADDLREAGAGGLQLITSREVEYGGQGAILPVYLTKGMEFDTVIVADAEGASYDHGELDVRLLYVAITRAAHRLHICHVGPIAPALDPGVTVTPPEALAEHYRREPVTVAQLVAETPEYEVDWCVERLAAAGQLRLLAGGCDRALLRLLMQRARRPAREESLPDSAPAKPAEQPVPVEVR
jgi:DNA helicase-2/ATP-dependent DNA helicase PcrA